MKKFTDFKSHIVEYSGHITEGKMNDLSVSIGDHMDKHIDNYKKYGGAEDLMSKAGHVAKKIAKQHKLKIQHAHNFVRDYMEKRLNESVELTEGRPSHEHPLEGHEYHKKTDAELEYIGKDAHKAAEAMKGHNEKAENKYRDQANDAATVRYFRKRSGTPDWYKKKYGLVKEETELEESVKIVDRDYDLDQEHFKLHVNGKTEHFVHHNYENSHASDSKAEIHYQVKNQLKHLSPQHQKEVTDAVHASYRIKEEVELEEGMKQTLRKYVPGYAKRELDKKMGAQAYAPGDSIKKTVDKDVNYGRYKKIADKLKKEEVEINERSLTSSEEEKVEDIVKGMKKNKKGFKERYGKRAREVMYATATKLAQNEEVFHEDSIGAKVTRQWNRLTKPLDQAKKDIDSPGMKRWERDQRLSVGRGTPEDVASRDKEAVDTLDKTRKDIHKNYATKESYSSEDGILDEMTISGFRTTRDLTKHLKKNGWSLGRTTGGHDVFVHATNKNNIAVPRHKGDIPPGTVRNILKTAGLHNEDVDHLMGEETEKQLRRKMGVKSIKSSKPDPEDVDVLVPGVGRMSKAHAEKHYPEHKHVQSSMSEGAPELLNSDYAKRRKQEKTNEEVESLREYPEDLAKMKKVDSYKVGDKIYTKVGGRWHKGHITTPLNKAGNHGVKFQHNGKTHSYVSSPDQLRLHIEEVVAEGADLYNEAVNVKQIKKDLDSGMSHDAVIGKHANKKLTNTPEIRKVIQQHAWDQRMKKEDVDLSESRKADIVKDAWKTAKAKNLKNSDNQTNVESESDQRKDSFQKDPEMSGEIVKQ